MDIRKVKKLMEMLEESGLTEIEIHEGEEWVRLSRQSPVVQAQTVVQGPETVAGQTPVPVTTEGTVSAADTSDERTPEGYEVKAPMVGIFYESPAPGKPPFVELGKSVVKGDVLCIIEAMKIMNQVEAETSGVIARITVENGDPVEYGQPLFLIREDA